MTNWVYYNARESALLAILFHTAGNTIGLYFSHLFSGPDLTRYYWLLLAMYVVATLIVVFADRKTWRSRSAVAPMNVEAIPGIA